MFPRFEGLQGVWEEWHEERQKARETAFSVGEFGPEDVTEYDLDTADITGQDNSDTYDYDPAIDKLNERDHSIKELPRH